MVEVFGSEEWRTVHAGSVIGLLELSAMDNRGPSSELDLRKREVERRLRTAYEGFERQDFLDLPVMAAYRRYYKKFKKTYHVQLQVESIVNQKRDLPAVSPLVDANFLAEMTTFVLTAGHDVAKLKELVCMDVSHEGDVIDQLGGGTKAIRPGDMVMRDAEGICCTIIYGQDDRSHITPATNHVLYVSYAPPGVSEAIVRTQLESIEGNIKLFSPTAKLEQCQLLVANEPP
jgi:DNA/RNA-binding domain of Phe-tRNA-synthetase-like protein